VIRLSGVADQAKEITKLNEAGSSAAQAAISGREGHQERKPQTAARF
jgi:hypothetical protein